MNDVEAAILGGFLGSCLGALLVYQLVIERAFWHVRDLLKRAYEESRKDTRRKR